MKPPAAVGNTALPGNPRADPKSSELPMKRHRITHFVDSSVWLKILRWLKAVFAVLCGGWYWVTRIQSRNPTRPN